MTLHVSDSQFYDSFADRGGAVFMRSWENGIQIFSNCVFRGNSTKVTGDRRGGALFLEEMWGVRFYGCSFTDNVADSHGGALYLHIRTGVPTGSEFINCGFTNNVSSLEDGGAIRIGNNRDMGSVLVSNSVFSGNSCGDGNGDNGGAIYADEGDDLVVVDCLFSGNSATYRGGAIGVNANDFGMQLHLERVDFLDNTSGNQGGAIWTDGYIVGEKITLTNCLFAGNENQGGDGGALLFFFNDAGIEIDVDNCTFHGNQTTLSGGGIYLQQGILNVTNSIFYENTAANGNAIYGDNGDTLNIGFCNVDQGEIGNIATVNIGDGMLDTDPLFADTANDDYHLKSLYGRWNGSVWVYEGSEISPSIDAGYTNSPYTSEVEPHGDRINMGRYGNTAEASLSDYGALQVVNRPVSALGLNTATLNGEMLSTNMPTDVFIYYGTVDAGATKTWQNVTDTGLQGLGEETFSNTVSITANTVYYYRCYASNSALQVWAPESSVFMSGAVTIEATDSAASEIGPDSGEFTVYRPATGTNGDLTVTYTMGGTADDGVDYNALAGTVTILEGETNATITVTPIRDEDLGEVSETVVLTLSDTGEYLVGTPSSNTVTIANNPTAYVVYVDPSATGASNGVSWTDAYTSLQTALDTEADGKIYWITAGSYTPGTVADDSFDIGANTFYGGFLGTETNVNERDWTNNVTTIDGLGNRYHVLEKTSPGTAVLDGLTVKDGRANSGNPNDDGAGLYVTSGKIVARHCIFTNNIANNLGGAMYLNAASVTHEISDCLFVGSTVDTDWGGAVYLENGDIDFDGCRFVNNTVNNGGGAVRITATGFPSPNFVDCHFTNNTATIQEGGAIYFDNSTQIGAVLISNCTFNGNDAGDGGNEGGGAIYGNQGLSMTVVDCLFTNNSAYNYGGAIQLWGGLNGMRLDVRNSQFYNNTAQRGGAATMETYGKGGNVFSNCVFRANTSSQEGGALRINNGDIEFVECSFTTNQCSNNDGGAVWLHVHGSYEAGFEDCGFTNNISANGNAGAVRLSNSQVEFDGCTFATNRSATAGGSVYIDVRAAGTSTFLNSEFRGNSAPSSVGGAMRFGNNNSMGPITVSNCVFSGNSSSGNGGVIFCDEVGAVSLTDSVFSNNVTAGEGGCIRMWQISDLQMTETDFVSNQANSYGGALRIRFRDSGTADLAGCDFIDNTSVSQQGGAIRMDGNGNMGAMALSNCTFSGNNSSGNGGAFYCDDLPDLTVVDTVFSNNVTADQGGAMRIWTGQFAFDGCTFVTNRANSNGGAIRMRVKDGGTADFAGCDFIDNSSANEDGGAIRMDGNAAMGAMVLSNCTFSGNSAGGDGADYGGAFYCDDLPELTVIDTVFSNNTATGEGGAIRIWTGEFTFDGCTFVTNQANSHGGAIRLRVKDGGTATFLNCDFLDNSSANEDGGAIRFENQAASGATLVSNCTFSGNSAGGDGGDHGGAIMHQQGGTMTIQDSSFQDNECTGIGGAVCIEGNANGVRLDMQRVDFIGNTSSVRGGAVYTSGYKSGENIGIVNCLFNGNETLANQGGALWMNFATDTEIDVNNCTFITNVAPVGGGAIYMQTGVLDVDNSIFYWNDGGSQADAIYGNNGDTVYLDYSNIDQTKIANVGTVNPGAGLINLDPLFVDAANGDVHLKSVFGHYDVGSSNWINDLVTSPCVDAGDPTAPYANEPEPKGEYLNMGRYGNTDEASKYGYLNVQNLGISGLSATSVTLSGTMVATNADPTTAYIFYGTVDGEMNKTWQDEGITLDVELGPFSNTVSLLPNTKYFWRCYASNSVSTAWADESLSFWTLGSPEVENAGTTPLTPSSASISGNLTIGGEATGYICWGDKDVGTGGTGTWDTVVPMGSVTQDVAFSTVITGLDTNATYWYRCFVTNAYGGDWSDSAALFSGKNVNTGGGGSGFMLKITFSGYTNTTPLTDFPAVVRLSDGITDFSYDDFISDYGYDLRFWDADETTSLNYEIEDWDESGESVVWVQVPEFTNNCYIWASWGDLSDSDQKACTTNGATWESNFRAVWHLHDTNAAGQFVDVTTNGNIGVNNGSVNTETQVVGDAQLFVDQYIDCGTDPSLDLTTGLTVSAWTYLEDNGNCGVVYAGGGWGQQGYCLHVNGNQMRAEVRGSALATLDRGLPTIQEWTLVTLRWDGTDVRMYYNGVQQGNAVNLASVGPIGHNFAIGRAGNENGRRITGMIDEVRAEEVARSVEWITASYSNQLPGSSFVSYGGVEQSGVIANMAATDITMSEAKFNAVLSAVDTNYDVHVYWGLENGGTSPSGWIRGYYVGSWTNVDSTNVSYTLSGIPEGTTNWYTFRATNANTNVWAEPSWTFTMPGTVQINPGAVFIMR